MADATVAGSGKFVRQLQPDVISWLVGAGIAGVLGVIVGALVDPLANYVLIPVFQGLKKRLGRKSAD